MTILIGILVILILLIFIYARCIEPYKLKVKEIKEGSSDGIKVLHISDIHFGKNINLTQLQLIVDTVNTLNYDVLVFTGDFFDDRFTGDISDIVDVLNNITNNKHMYAIWGNHDYKSHASTLHAQLLSEAGVTLLCNEDDVIEIRNRSLRIVGSDDYIKGEFDKDYLESISLDCDNLLLLHEPDAIDYFDYSNYKFVLSGHSHGGQVVLPCGIRGRNRMCSKYQEGLFVLSAHTKLYVSGGIGTTGMRLRFMTPPSISLITL